MATDLDELAARARERMRPDWNEHRERRVLEAIRRAPPSRRLRMAHRGRWIAAGAAAAVIGAVLVLAWPDRDAVLEHPSRLELEDGSVCVLESGAHLSASARSAALIRLVQTDGRVRYEVSHRPERTFEVIAEPVTVRVRGTRFVVDVTPTIVTVSVEHGRVEVLAGSRVTELTDGETLSVPRRRPPPEPPRPEASAPRLVEASREERPSPDVRHAVGEAPAPPAPSGSTPPAREAPSRTPAASSPSAARGTAPARPGRSSRRAPSALPTASASSREVSTARQAPAPLAPRETAPVDPEAVLAQADAHRRAGRPREAVAVLERFLVDHAEDVRAPSAAFTLGRLRRQLGDHVAAAQAYARAYAGAPDGPLAEDALAYEALSWAAAGESERAMRAARRYLERYPAGLHARQLSPLLPRSRSTGE
ncbi:MAG TPA: FecR domain-containing protein [Sandaracinaceae bacterium]